MSKAEKKKSKERIPSYEIKIVPVEYEAQGLFLKDLLDPAFVKTLSKEIGEFNVVNISFHKGDDIIMLWHKSSEDAENKVVTVMCKNQKLLESLVKALKGES